MKFCKDCEFYKKPSWFSHEDRCIHFENSKTDPVTGEVGRWSARHFRDLYCGKKDAKYFKGAK